jgi:hypothetical protein
MSTSDLSYLQLGQRKRNYLAFSFRFHRAWIKSSSLVQRRTVSHFKVEEVLDRQEGGKMFSQKSVKFYQTTRRHIPTDIALHSHRRQNLKPNHNVDSISACPLPFLSIALQPIVWPWPLFQFLDLFTQSVWLLGWGITLSQGRNLHVGQHKHRINVHRYPCLKWDSNSRSQCLRRRRQFMP